MKPTLQGLQAGYLVRLKKHFDGIKEGTCAFVYHTEPDYLQPDHNAAYLITSAGFIIGRMSVSVQNKYLDFIGESDYSYNYQDKVKLKRDWTDGVIQDVFRKCNG